MYTTLIYKRIREQIEYILERLTLIEKLNELRVMSGLPTYTGQMDDIENYYKKELPGYTVRCQDSFGDMYLTVTTPKEKFYKFPLMDRDDKVFDYKRFVEYRNDMDMFDIDKMIEDIEKYNKALNGVDEWNDRINSIIEDIVDVSRYMGKYDCDFILDEILNKYFGLDD